MTVGDENSVLLETLQALPETVLHLLAESAPGTSLCDYRVSNYESSIGVIVGRLISVDREIWQPRLYALLQSEQAARYSRLEKEHHGWFQRDDDLLDAMTEDECRELVMEFRHERLKTLALFRQVLLIVATVTPERGEQLRHSLLSLGQQILEHDQESLLKIKDARQAQLNK